jgi:CRISPR-associated endonuclease/helicase Cas3
MTNSIFFAHSTAQVDETDWEPLLDHLKAVGRRASEMAAKFDAGPLGEIAGLLHDIGKYEEAFQRRLRGDPVRHDHSTAGAGIAAERFGLPGHLIAFAIAGHHAGLANEVRYEGDTRSSLTERLADARGRTSIVLETARTDGLEVPDAIPVWRARERDNPGFQLGFLGRMLFSCLVDADYVETERFYAEVEGWQVERGCAIPLVDLRARLDDYLAKLAPKGSGDVVALRNAVLAHARAQAGARPGVFTLTVPTGGGKTLTSLAFALDHVIRHGMDRVVYVIPYTSIIDQTAAVFRAALDPLGDAVLEHHSTFDEERIEGREAKSKLYLAMENWEFPIVVTTGVQFFESLFAARPSRCRKLHNLARSVIILDEVQTLPLDLLKPCVAALKELARHFGASIVLCTATQPALTERDDPALGFAGGFKAPRELAPDPPRLFRGLRRVRIQSAGRLDDDALAERLAAQDQVLCIVNTREHARSLFRRIARLPGAHHLSTLMHAKHRRAVLAAIRQNLERGLSCRLVSTSLIEAGVDIDFPRVYRAAAGLDRIAQAAGRCNRHGIRSPADSQTVVFEPTDDKHQLRTLRQETDAGRETLRQFDDPLEPAAIESYFRRLYWGVGDERLDRHGIMTACHADRTGLNIPYERIARDVRLIEDSLLPVIVPDDETASKLVEALHHVDRPGGIARKLQPYSVGVPRDVRAHLIAAGAAAKVEDDRFGDQFVVLQNIDLYRPDTGLDWSDPTFLESTDLIVG